MSHHEKDMQAVFLALFLFLVSAGCPNVKEAGKSEGTNLKLPVQLHCALRPFTAFQAS